MAYEDDMKQFETKRGKCFMKPVFSLRLIDKALSSQILIAITLLTAINVVHCNGRARNDEYVFVTVDVQGQYPDRIDVLFVVDNSRSMVDEQGLIEERLASLVRELVDPENGRLPVANNLHVGVITTDMGVDGHVVPSCENPNGGDQGVLQNTGRNPGCQEEYTASDCSRANCPWLSHSLEHPDDNTEPSNPSIWQDIGCISSLGTHGCGYVQPLEASLVALTVNSQPGGVNEGFLRDDSLIVIVYITDSDDCSAQTSALFDPEFDNTRMFDGRCFENEEMLHPIDRYYEAFSNLRPGRPDLLVIAVFGGTPTDDFSWVQGEPIEELRELQEVDPENPSELLPVCESDSASASPPVRIVELAARLEESERGYHLVWSLCRDNWSDLFRVVVFGGISEVMKPHCLNAPLPTTELGSCRVIETLRDDDPCYRLIEDDPINGFHVDVGLDEYDRRQCEIQLADHDSDGCPDPVAEDQECECTSRYTGCRRGWFYTGPDDRCENGRIVFTDDTSDFSTYQLICRVQEG